MVRKLEHKFVQVSKSEQHGNSYDVDSAFLTAWV